MTVPTDHSAQQAQHIYQDLLDRIGQSYRDNDFDGFTQMIATPHQVNTFTLHCKLETNEELRKLFNNITTFIATRNITHYERECLSAQFVNKDTIEGVHETHMLSGTQHIQDHYPVKSILKLKYGRWMVMSSENAIEETEDFAGCIARARP